MQVPTLAYADLATFFKGLEGVIGPPSIALKETIERERARCAVELRHCLTQPRIGVCGLAISADTPMLPRPDCASGDAHHEFTVPNYGTKTTSYIVRRASQLSQHPTAPSLRPMEVACGRQHAGWQGTG
jgi:hypothetical protein